MTPDDIHKAEALLKRADDLAYRLAEIDGARSGLTTEREEISQELSDILEQLQALRVK